MACKREYNVSALMTWQNEGSSRSKRMFLSVHNSVGFSLCVWTSDAGSQVSSSASRGTQIQIGICQRCSTSETAAGSAAADAQPPRGCGSEASATGQAAKETGTMAAGAAASPAGGDAPTALRCSALSASAGLMQ